MGVRYKDAQEPGLRKVILVYLSKEYGECLESHSLENSFY